nr:uncharacterized protein I303_00237 [Kwoniella dejecticola CBS 10117]OBR88420.1 hypothetical protein I303_00237 [Kwoniella dejecticola CBS 10117]
MLSSYSSLPTNDELPFLPPLPDTPQHAYKSYLSEEYLLKAKTPITRKLWEERSNSPFENQNEGGSRTLGRLESTRKWDVEIDYPVLTTRQSVFNTPNTINRVPSIDLLKTVRTPSQPKLEEETPSPDSLQTVVQFSKQPTSQPKIAERIIKPLISTNTVKCDSDSDIVDVQAPSKVMSAHPQPSQPRISASFNLPTYIADQSLLADQSIMAASSGDEDSFRLDIDKLRPKPRVSEDLIPSCLATKSTSPPPHKIQLPGHSSLAVPQNPLDRSTLLPRSPAKTAHLLEPTYALNHVEPPWADESEIFETCLDINVNSRESSLSPQKPSHGSQIKNKSKFPPSKIDNGFPSSTSLHAIISVPKVKRTFPASSSAQSLASLGDENEGMAGGDISTLLPVSPMKTAHLLTDSELITNEYLNMEDGEKSFRLPLPSRATPFKPSFMSKTPRKSPPARMSPIKTIVKGLPSHSHSHAGKAPFVDGAADMTFEVKDLLARVNKPKRASGTEESFVDLLHDDLMIDGLDTSMMGPDESMLPPSLRPRGLRGNSMSPIKPTSYASPIRHPSTVLPTTIEHAYPADSIRMPSTHSTHDLASRKTREGHQESQTGTFSRSKSLSRVAEIIERVKHDRARSQITETYENGDDQDKEGPHPALSSPPKTAIRARTFTTARTPAPTTSALALTADTDTVRPSRSRTSMMPASTSTSARRVSLSVGARPLGGSASHDTMDLPSTRPRPSKIDAPPVPTAASRGLTAARPPPSSTTTSRLTSDTSKTAVAPRTARASMAPPAVPALACSRVDPKPRLGSATSTIISSTTASIPSITSRPPVSRISRPPTTSGTVTSSRASSAGVAAIARSSAVGATRTSRPSTAGRSGGLPRPSEGSGLGARSATSNSSSNSSSTAAPGSRPAVKSSTRGFGHDASNTANKASVHPPRPSSTAIPGKILTGPSAVTKTTSMKSRALSTPANSTVPSSKANAGVPAVPTLPRTTLTRPTTSTSASASASAARSAMPSGLAGDARQRDRAELLKKSSLPPSTSTFSQTQIQRSRAGPRTTASATGAVSSLGSNGLPRPSSIRSKMSAPPGSASASGNGTGTGLTALRERLDKLHARQGK